MPTLHDLNAALRGKLHDQQLPQAREHLLHIAAAAKEVMAHVRCEPMNELSACDIDAIGALIAHWATQLGVIVDGEQRLAAQYINRLADLMREQSKATDPLRVEVLAWGILCGVEKVRMPRNDEPLRA